jgi:hypothetical protein
MWSEVVTTFSTKSFKGTPYGRAKRSNRSNLDKGTLAAAHIGLVRAGQRPPDRRTAYGPPPLVKAAALSARGVPEARWFGRENQRDDDDQGEGLSGGMTGDGPRRGVGQGRALPGGGPMGAASRRLASPPRSPWAGGRPPIRANRHRSRAESTSASASGRVCLTRWTAMSGRIVAGMLTVRRPARDLGGPSMIWPLYCSVKAARTRMVPAAMSRSHRRSAVTSPIGGWRIQPAGPSTWRG